MKFYEKDFPSLNEIVVVRVVEIQDYGVNVELLEYGVKGLVVAKEISRKRIRTIKEVLRVGQETAAQVLATDTESGCLDLSIKLCTPEEIAAALNRYQQHYILYNLLNRHAEVTGTKVADHLAALIWPCLAEDPVADIYALFVNLNNPETDSSTVIPAEYPHRTALLELIATRLPKPTFSATQTVKLICVDSKKAPELLTQALNTAACMSGVNVWIIAPPEYKFTAQGKSQREADATLANAKKKVLEISVA